MLFTIIAEFFYRHKDLVWKGGVSAFDSPLKRKSINQFSYTCSR